MSLFAQTLAIILTVVLLFGIFLWFISANDPFIPYVVLSVLASIGLYSVIESLFFVMNLQNLGEENAD